VPCSLFKKDTFVFEEPLLTPDAASVAYKFAVSSYDSMAGYDDGDRITVVCHAHRSGCSFISYTIGNVAVTTVIPNGILLNSFQTLFWKEVPSAPSGVEKRSSFPSK
jgi:hypothetical protein